MKKRLFLFVIIFIFIMNNIEYGIAQENINIIKEWKNTLKKYPVKKESIPLLCTSTYPTNVDEDNGNYLWDADRMSEIVNNEFAVVDKKAMRMILINNIGEIKKIVGKHGQGPGEFQNPYCISRNEKYIVVNDTFNMTMTFFNVYGEYIKSVKMFKAYYDIEINKNGLIFAVPMRIDNSLPMIDVLDENGIIKYSFGEPMYGSNMEWQMPNMIMITLNNQGDIFIAYKYFPLVCKYSEKGELKKKIYIENKIMKKGEEYNMGRKPRSGFSIVIYGLCATKNNIYIMNINPRIEILEYDFDGNNEKIYNYEATYDTRYTDIKVNVEDNKNVFYLLKKTPENCVNVFRPNIQIEKEGR